VAAKNGLLDDVEAGWDFHEARNRISRTYNPAIAQEVAATARVFAPLCAHLIQTLQAQADDA
jgi:hypothetical protein